MVVAIGQHRPLQSFFDEGFGPKKMLPLAQDEWNAAVLIAEAEVTEAMDNLRGTKRTLEDKGSALAVSRRLMCRRSTPTDPAVTFRRSSDHLFVHD